jgi:uncharacterized protein YdhG (YjbR/CyaY superfamily)
MSSTQQSGTDEASGAFSPEERAAMKERAQEVRTAKRRGRAGADPGAELLAKIAEMADEDRAVAEQVHALVREAAPGLEPRTWYGMPAYARDGKVVCFFQPAAKFRARYATLGFNEDARLDDGAMWPTAFALTRITEAEAGRIRELVARAAGLD